MSSSWAVFSKGSSANAGISLHWLQIFFSTSAAWRICALLLEAFSGNSNFRLLILPFPIREAAALGLNVDMQTGLWL
jgi:hypothetical protein